MLHRCLKAINIGCARALAPYLNNIDILTKRIEDPKGWHGNL